MARVLVVEDDAGLRAVLAEVLIDEGHEVVEAPHGAAALEEVAARLPDVILLDMRMPVMDGWAFARAYRARPGPHAPIVGMTAAQDARAWCDEIGADGCLAKPFEFDALAAEIGRVAG